MTDVNNKGLPEVPEVVDNVVDEINRAAESEYVQVTVSRVTPRISAKVRNIIYTVGVALGAVGTLGPVVTTLLTGDAAVLGVSAVSIAYALSNLLAKLNLSKTADDVSKTGI